MPTPHTRESVRDRLLAEANATATAGPAHQARCMAAVALVLAETTVDRATNLRTGDVCADSLRRQLAALTDGWRAAVDILTLDDTDDIDPPTPMSTPAPRPARRAMAAR